MIRFVWVEQRRFRARHLSARSMAVLADGAWLERLWVSMLRGFTTGADCGQTLRIHLYAVREERSVADAGMKLRLHRKHSIKLMLAWGTCCRRFSLSSLHGGLVLLTRDDIFLRKQRSALEFSSPTRRFLPLRVYKAWSSIP